jgi:hypothetical protein
MATKAAPRRPRGRSANARRILRELIFIALAEANGSARASSVLRTVRQRAEDLVPVEWRKPHLPYRSRIELYAAFERASLRDAGLIDATEHGIWKLTPAGWIQAKQLMAAWRNGEGKPRILPEALTPKSGRNWIGRVAGSLRDEPAFAEVLRLGRDARRKDRPD